MSGFQLPSHDQNPRLRHIPDLEQVRERVAALRVLGQSIVLTQGTFDLLHIDHLSYLHSAKATGDVLIVGVDSDEKVRHRKGDSRPIVPEGERLAMLCFQRPVDYVVVKELAWERWELIKAIRPDVLIATSDTYSDDDKLALEEFCREVRVIESVSTTSTSAKIRRAQIALRETMEKALTSSLIDGIPSLVEHTITNYFDPERDG